MFRRDRVNRQGSGVIAYISSSLNPTCTNLLADAESADGFEASFCETHQHRLSLPILVIFLSSSAFLDDNSHRFRALKLVFIHRDDCLIVGDFNGQNVDWEI